MLMIRLISSQKERGITPQQTKEHNTTSQERVGMPPSKGEGILCSMFCFCFSVR